MTVPVGAANVLQLGVGNKRSRQFAPGDVKILKKKVYFHFNHKIIIFK
jgi:hypothetical protein